MKKSFIALVAVFSLASCTSSKWSCCKRYVDTQKTEIKAKQKADRSAA